MSTRDRLDKESVRCVLLTSLEGEDVLTAKDNDDVEAAKRGVVARRLGLLRRMTPAEQRSHRPKRQ